MSNGNAKNEGPTCKTSAVGSALHRPGRWITAALVVLLTGCTANHVQTNDISATSRPVDVACSRCAMKHYVWDSVGWRGGGRKVHHDVWEMECPNCVVRMSGIWLLIGPSHRCMDCPAGVERCPKCQAADRDDGKYPATRPEPDPSLVGNSTPASSDL